MQQAPLSTSAINGESGASGGVFTSRESGMNHPILLEKKE
jgi:hypothetical protein